MSIEELVEVVHGKRAWLGSKEEAKQLFFTNIFGATDGRYPQQAANSVTLRAPQISAEENVRYAAYIHPTNPDSGAYGGMSVAIFPAADGAHPCLLTFVVGTSGLSPDDHILGRPGHARKVQALCAWLNEKHGKGAFVAWAKQDPVRTDLAAPDTVVRGFADYRPAFDKYGRELYAIYRPSTDLEATREAVTAFLDLMFQERGHKTVARHDSEADRIEAEWFAHLMPDVSRQDVAVLLRSRRYVVIQGPPGTGKTRMALELLRDEYADNGKSIQFHPNTTYENFVGGLAPRLSDTGLGLQFAPAQGSLMEAAAAAKADPDHPYLLHIDELNRADLGKVLGEAIYLFEPDESPRRIELAYEFGDPPSKSLSLPPNLHVLGTMNSTDRSLAIVDVAVRRRFAFVKLWPQPSVVDAQQSAVMTDAFRELERIFIEHASGETFDLVPGHSYFLIKDGDDAKRRLQVTLVPLLEEYLSQGYVGGFAEQIRSYLQWVDSL